MKKWRLNTRLKSKKKKDIANLVFLVSSWCNDNLSSKKHAPMIWVDWEKSPIYGEYVIDDNEIVIYGKTNKNVRDLIDTTIHEWAHFLQDKKNLLKSLKKFDDDSNPNEIEAIELAEKWVKKCWKDIKNGKVHLYNS